MSLTELEVSAAIDRAAVDRFQDGEWAAFEELYGRHRDRLLRYCQYRLRDRHEAEDVAQEAFVRAWRSMPTFGGDRNFYPWLRVVASNLCTDALRKRSRSEPAGELDLDSFQFTDHPETARLEAEDDRQMVRQALARLNARHQSALLMREDEGLAYEEIAARTGVSTSTVESLLWRARQSFRREFTVLSASQACLAVLGVPLALTGWFRHAVHSVAARFHQRLSLAGFLSFSPDAPGFHTAALTTAGVVVATVVAAAVGIGGSAPAAPAVPPARTVLPGHPVAAGAGQPGPAPSHRLVAPAAADRSSSPGGGPAVAGAPTPTAVTVPTTATTATTAGTAGPAPTFSVPIIPHTRAGLPSGLRSWKPPTVVNPVSSGAPAAGQGTRDPIGLPSGPVAVGIDPAAVTSYARSAVAELASPLQSVSRSICPTSLPGC